MVCIRLVMLPQAYHKTRCSFPELRRTVRCTNNFRCSDSNEKFTTIACVSISYRFYLFFCFHHTCCWSVHNLSYLLLRLLPQPKSKDLRRKHKEKIVSYIGRTVACLYFMVIDHTHTPHKSEIAETQYVATLHGKQHKHFGCPDSYTVEFYEFGTDLFVRHCLRDSMLSSPDKTFCAADLM